MSIRNRILLLFVLVVTAGFGFLTRWIADDLRPRYLESIEESLVDTSNLLAQMVELQFRDQQDPAAGLAEAFSSIQQRDIRARIYGFTKNGFDLRVYITDAAGRVLFDSRGSAKGQDYSQWNDVYLTLRGQYGARATKESGPNKSSTMYVAAPLTIKGELVGVLSVGKPANNVDKFIALAERKFWLAGAVATFIVLLLGAFLYLWMTIPLQRLGDYAQRVRAGERIALPQMGNHEVGEVGRAMEGMRQALEDKAYVESYVQNLTHELKSPLAAIRGAAELLGEDVPAEEQQRFTKNILLETQRLDDLVERMLALAALEKQNRLEQPEEVALPAVCQNAAESLRGYAQSRDIQIELHTDSATVFGDEFLLQLALTNLLKNAVDFSPERAVVKLQQKANEVVILDQGPGVPEYAEEKIFDKFYSLPRPSGQRKSSGLGLSFVKEIAELHGGKVAFKNRENGCEFSFVLGAGHKNLTKPS